MANIFTTKRNKGKYSSPYNIYIYIYIYIYFVSYGYRICISYCIYICMSIIGLERNLTVVIVKRLVRTNNVVKVSVHQFINNVNIIKGILSGRSYDIPNSNYLGKKADY